MKCKPKIGTAEWIVIFLVNRSLGKRGGTPIFHLHLNLTNWYYCLTYWNNTTFLLMARMIWTCLICLKSGRRLWREWQMLPTRPWRTGDLLVAVSLWLESRSEFMKQFLLRGHGLASTKMPLTDEVSQQPPTIKPFKEQARKPLVLVIGYLAQGGNWRSICIYFFAFKLDWFHLFLSLLL